MASVTHVQLERRSNIFAQVGLKLSIFSNCHRVFDRIVSFSVVGFDVTFYTKMISKYESDVREEVSLKYIS